MSSSRRIRDKWRRKSWYTVISPPYFGNVELGSVPADEPDKLIGRVVEATLYDITGDFAHQYLKMYFRITRVDGKTAYTMFKGHEYSRDYLRSLVRRRTTRVDGIFNVTTKDGYVLRVSVCAFTLARIKTSQEQEIRKIMKSIVEEKAKQLTFDQFAQEIVLGKIASDIYNEAKKIAPLRHVGVRKSKLLREPEAKKEEVEATATA
ncbi:30S ribosomal protein S3ae [Candidatus Bathyarchaeota archaeon]|nr:MAG: 30S ribosomal protein S3ae [Candidatus Bathyarchaeota archaeon]RLI27872.1 MAG: 30S ribosomal protein S3ae [Candidatus Bathyarchaeota archaeon]